MIFWLNNQTELAQMAVIRPLGKWPLHLNMSGPFYWHDLTLIPAWISYYTSTRNYPSILKPQWRKRWSLGKDKYYHITLYCTCNVLSMLGLQLNHITKRGPSCHPCVLEKIGNQAHTTYHKALGRRWCNWVYRVEISGTADRALTIVHLLIVAFRYRNKKS